MYMRVHISLSEVKWTEQFCDLQTKFGKTRSDVGVFRNVSKKLFLYYCTIVLLHFIPFLLTLHTQKLQTLAQSALLILFIKECKESRSLATMMVTQSGEFLSASPNH